MKVPIWYTFVIFVLVLQVTCEGRQRD